MSSQFAGDFARAVRGMLAEEQISGADLARALDRSPGYVSERQNAKAFWDTSDLDVIADLLGITPVELIRRAVGRMEGDARDVRFLTGRDE